MAEDTRVTIIRAASAEFASLGFHGARTARIARSAGVNKQLLFYYFGNKSGLYVETVRSATVALLDFRSKHVPETPQAGAERVRSWVALAATMCEEHPRLVRLVVGSVDGPPEAASLGRLFLRNLAAELAKEISNGQGLGFFRDDAEPTVIATQALALMFGFDLVSQAADTGQPAAERQRWDAATADLVVRTLSW